MQSENEWEELELVKDLWRFPNIHIMVYKATFSDCSGMYAAVAQYQKGCYCPPSGPPQPLAWDMSIESAIASAVDELLEEGGVNLGGNKCCDCGGAGRIEEPSIGCSEMSICKTCNGSGMRRGEHVVQ